MNKQHEHAEEWTPAEEMLRQACTDSQRSKSTYQWAIGAVLSLLTFVLGVECQGERLTPTVIESKTKISGLENDITNLRKDVNWIRENIATKADIERLVK